MRNTLKLGVSLAFKSMLLFYVSNIVIYFSFVRHRLIEGVDVLIESAKTREIFKAENISKDDLLNMTLCDTEIFNPFYNIGYSFGNYFLLIPSIFIVVIFLLFLQFKNRIKENHKAHNKSESISIQDRVEDLIADLSEKELKIFADENKLNLEDHNSIHVFIQSLSEEEAEVIVKELELRKIE